MAEILICNQSTNLSTLQNQLGISTDSLSGPGCINPDTLNRYTPYAIGENISVQDKSIMRLLGPMPVSRELTNLSLSLGEDNTLALAEITEGLKNYNIGLLGTSTSVYANRVSGFAGSVKDYQDALMQYRQAIKSNPAAKAVSKQKAIKSFQKMQIRFKHELNAVNAGIKSKKGTPLTNSTRGTNIARSSRSVAKLNVTSQVQANNLVKFSKHAKVLGNGLALIDFGSRVGNIHNSYKAGEEWEREMFIESSSFALSAGTGIAAVNAGGAVLSLLMVATPIGWVGLIIGGVVVAGVAASASIGVNNYTKSQSGDLYDYIMNNLGVK